MPRLCKELRTRPTIETEHVLGQDISDTAPLARACWALALRLGHHHWGKKVLVGHGEGAVESYEAWLGFFRDLKARELRASLLSISDGAPRPLRAFQEAFSPPNECGIIKSSAILAVWER